MTEPRDDTHPVRQFRVTITEDRDGRCRAAMLSWRTFPCAASKWDGTRWYTFEETEQLPVTTLAALRDCLATISVGEWQEARYPRQPGR